MPNVQDIHVDAALTNLSVASMNPMDAFIADKVFKKIPSKYRSDKYYVYDQSFLLRSEAQERGSKTLAPIRDHGISNTTFTCKWYSIGELVGWDEIDNADPIIDPIADAVDVVTQDIMLQREKLFASTALTTSVWATDYDVTTTGTAWDAAAADILGDVDTGKQTVATGTGIPEDLLSGVMTADVWNVVKRDADILSGFGGGDSSKKIATVDHVRQLMGLKELHIMRAVENSAIEGAAASYARVKAEAMLIYFSPDAPGKKKAAAGYNFVHKDIEISRFARNEYRADQVEANSYYVPKVVMTTAGYYLYNQLT